MVPPMSRSVHLGNIICWSWCCPLPPALPISLPSSSLSPYQILLVHQTRWSHSLWKEATPCFWLQGLGPLLTWHPGVCGSKYSLLGLFPGVPIRRRDLVKSLFEDEAEVLIGGSFILDPYRQCLKSCPLNTLFLEFD